MAQHRPLPKELCARAMIPGIPDARAWGDEYPPHLKAHLDVPKEELHRRYPGVVDSEFLFLAHIPAKAGHA